MHSCGCSAHGLVGTGVQHQLRVSQPAGWNAVGTISQRRRPAWQGAHSGISRNGREQCHPPPGLPCGRSRCPGCGIGCCRRAESLQSSAGCRRPQRGCCGQEPLLPRARRPPGGPWPAQPAGAAPQRWCSCSSTARYCCSRAFGRTDGGWRVANGSNCTPVAGNAANLLRRAAAVAAGVRLGPHARRAAGQPHHLSITSRVASTTFVTSSCSGKEHRQSWLARTPHSSGKGGGTGGRAGCMAGITTPDHSAHVCRGGQPLRSSHGCAHRPSRSGARRPPCRRAVSQALCHSDFSDAEGTLRNVRWWPAPDGRACRPRCASGGHAAARRPLSPPRCNTLLLDA